MNTLTEKEMNKILKQAAKDGIIEFPEEDKREMIISEKTGTKYRKNQDGSLQREPNYA